MTHLQQTPVRCAAGKVRVMLSGAAPRGTDEVVEDSEQRRDEVWRLTDPDEDPTKSGNIGRE